MAEEQQEAAGSAFELEYVTSGVPLVPNEGISVYVVNDSSVDENARVVIYRSGGASAITVVDTGRVLLTPTWTWSLRFPIKDPGVHWLRIQTTAESLIPKALFERGNDVKTWQPLVCYKPGDFAVFRLTRKRIWR